MTTIEPTPAETLAGIRPALAKALATRGYVNLTPVQLAMLEDGHAEADLLVSAQTGSGKTVAFGMAIAPTLLGEAERFGPASLPLGLVIAPTRELALQVQREFDWLYAETGIVTASCVGGMDMRTERRALDRGAHLVVGTPGRLRDHITKNSLDLSALRAVVLDEADEMLDLGFREDLEFILAAAPEERRTLMFSATVPRPIALLAKTFQRDAVRLAATASTEPHADIEYQMVLVQPAERENAIINTLLYFDSSSTLVFCHTREAVKHLTARLSNRGFSVVALSGELTQSERTNALQAMRDGRARVCVATDVAARGIDLPNLDLVVHADLPTNPDTLLHRSGRTGRAGRKGICVIIVPMHRRGAASRVLKLANLTATTRPAPTLAMIDARYRQQILDTAVATLPADETEAPFVAELLSRLTPELIAAAYLRQQFAARPVAEDIADTPMPSFSDKPARAPRGENPEGGGDTRHVQMTDGVWFTVSVGRKQRADPKWLLPLICKAGGVTKRDVGSIKIEDAETRFEISARAAKGFSASLAIGGTLEKGITIKLAGGSAGGSGERPPRPERSEPWTERKPRHVERSEPASERPAYAPERTAYAPEQNAAEPRYKVRTDRGEKLNPVPTDPRVSIKPIRPPRANPKDKGKPKAKYPTAEAPGSATRQRPPRPTKHQKP